MVSRRLSLLPCLRSIFRLPPHSLHLLLQSLVPLPRDQRLIVSRFLVSLLIFPTLGLLPLLFPRLLPCLPLWISLLLPHLPRRLSLPLSFLLPLLFRLPHLPLLLFLLPREARLPSLRLPFLPPLLSVATRRCLSPSSPSFRAACPPTPQLPLARVPAKLRRAQKILEEW
ncbi:zinc carboxypeptidase superfamily protein [Toxoplasma gondii FOU]|uniref:Zinc carboxypeptidase superfamily protein n=2 Tax=Toxoplasma gondii TaxID=5811 RepID=A0A086L1D6_TOXGO|nr:zinc carboxypeptidase superfamily protein [Toxoplasma gondii FOU]PUA92239.1 zinc carboxypeptidase superfamily protein [Toxoplasma gondii TgCATBr9]